jgi:hypothetical protein
MTALTDAPARDALGPGSDALAFWRVRFLLALERPMRLPPFAGSLFHGALGCALRRVACEDGAVECTGGAHAAGCAYGSLFEAGRADSVPAPRPFVLSVDLPERSWLDAGCPFPLDLVLIGGGRSHLPEVVSAVAEMGRQGLGPRRVRAQLREVQDLGPAGHRTLALGGARPDPAGVPRDWTTAHLPGLAGERVRLVTRSPLRLTADGGPVSRLDLPLLLRALFRRIGALARLHCGFEPSLDYGRLLDDAARVRLVESDLTWTDRRRYSARQRRRMALGGLTGTVSFAGEIAPFAPFLRLGEVLHVGKGTSFGLGRYRLEPDPEGPG